MRREPSLTFDGALRILGRQDRPLIEQLDDLLGTGLLVAGALGTVGTIAAGPTALPALGMFAAVWGWLEPEGRAIDLLRKAIGRISRGLAETSGYERRQLIAAAHTTIVVAAFFEEFEEHVGTKVFKRLKLSDEDKKAMISRGTEATNHYESRASRPSESIYENIYGAEIPAPSPACGFEENTHYVRDAQYSLGAALQLFLNGSDAMVGIKPNWDGILDKAVERYRSYFLSLAATVPEFAIWASLGEHAATRVAIVGLRADITAALDGQRYALGRIDALLALDAPSFTTTADTTPPMAGSSMTGLSDLRAALARANRGTLVESIIPAETRTYGPDITFPTVNEIYVNPRYRITRLETRRHRDRRVEFRSYPVNAQGHVFSEETNEILNEIFNGVVNGRQPSDEQWWEMLPSRDDFDLMLAGYVTSPEATRLPMLLLGHPGSGKSMMVKLLAARLPSAVYTVVRVPLRRVGGNAPIIDQIQQALDLATNQRIEWVRLIEQSASTVRVVLLDGLDELLQASQHDRSGFLQEVAEFQRIEAEQQRPLVVMVTSRTVVADRVTIPDGTTIVKLDPFTEDDVAEWIHKWGRANREAIATGRMGALSVRTSLRQPELSRQPLLLLMLALYAADTELPPLDADVSAAELYRRLLDGFARREAAKSRDLVQGREEDEFEQQVQDHLDRLAVAALGMFNRGRQDINEEDLGKDLEALDPRLMERSRPVEAGQRIIGEFFFVHAPEARLLTGQGDVLPEIGGEGRLRVRPEQARRSYEFLHATFGEYLVARQVMDELVAVADKAFADRRGRGLGELDDDRLYALLCHQPLVVRASMIEFAIEIFRDLDDEDDAKVFNVLEVLLGSYRNRHGSDKYAAYRPVTPDQVRRLACYSANLVALRIGLATDPSGVPVSKLLRASDDDALDDWRSTVMLWRAGLEADGLQAMVEWLAMSEPGHHIVRLAEQTLFKTALSPTESEIRLAHLTDNIEIERRLQYGAALANGQRSNLSPWANQAACVLIPAIVGWTWYGGGSIGPPPPGTASEDIDIVRDLIFEYLNSRTYYDRDQCMKFLRLLFNLPLDRNVDGRALASAVITDPSLLTDIPNLNDLQLYGPYADIVREAVELAPSDSYYEMVSGEQPPEVRHALARSYEIVEAEIVDEDD